MYASTPPLRIILSSNCCSETLDTSAIKFSIMALVFFKRWSIPLSNKSFGAWLALSNNNFLIELLSSL